MQKHFNTAGPSTPDLHYLLDPMSRFDQDEIRAMIDQRRYFVLHAPRQTGKTTCLLALRDRLNAEGRYAALYVNVEAAQVARGDVHSGTRAVLSELGSHARRLFGLKDFDATLPQLLLDRGAQAAFSEALRKLSQALSKPLVLLLDEVDALVGDTLISLLRQIRAGYTDRPKAFPQTVILCGVRDVRDYRMTMADGEVITGGSAFNIKAESLRLGDFSEVELRALYQQHSHATGQAFSEKALQLAWHLTRGQPWLSNALAEQAVWKTKSNRDRSMRITAQKIRAAGQALILRNDTHLDQLTDKLREPRVQRVIEPLLLGVDSSASDEDFQYALDLGLIRVQGKTAMPANAIYAEVLPRVLSSVAQRNLSDERILPSWQTPTGQLNCLQLLRNFLDFWVNDGESMMATVPYHEAAPHLVLMAYLQRVINGGGRIERDYAAGSGRLDLLVVYRKQRMAIEVKVWRDKSKDPLDVGLLQIERYLQRLNLAEGYLVIFDQRSSAPSWEERISLSEVATASGKPVWLLRG